MSLADTVMSLTDTVMSLAAHYVTSTFFLLNFDAFICVVFK
jgi:hypothetical protein